MDGTLLFNCSLDFSLLQTLRSKAKIIMIFFWLGFLLTFPVIVSLESWFLRQHLTSIGWLMLMNLIAWALYVAVNLIFFNVITEFKWFYIVLLEGVLLGLLMGFLRSFAFNSQLIQSKKMIASSVITGVFSLAFSINLAFFLVRDQEGLAQAGLLGYWFLLLFPLFYHTLNRAALIWFLRDSPSPAQ